MNKIKKLYILESIMLIIYFLLKTVISQHYTFLFPYFDLLFYFLVFLYFYWNYGIPRNKNYLKQLSFRYVIMALLAYVLIIYALGCFTGFTKNAFTGNWLNLLGVSGMLLITIFFKEVIRFIASNHSKKQIGPYIYLTVILISFDIYTAVLGSTFATAYQVFAFLCVSILPSIARNILSSYITYEISYTPSFIFNAAFTLAPYVLPIFPDLGDYINSVLGILFPLIIYLTLQKWAHYQEKKAIRLTGHVLRWFGIPICLFAIVLVVLVSGVFSYQMIAIGSDSMNPIYYKGDAVIYEKKPAEEIKEGDILVFNHNYQVITHRVTRIIEEGNTKYFQTKGDNNDSVDAELVPSSNVLGTVKYIVKYVGYPTIWFSELK